MSEAQRKYFTQIAALTEKFVSVTTINGKSFTGTLIGINPDNLSLALTDAKEEKGEKMNRLFINGSIVAQISTADEAFDLKALAQRLEKVFPRMVKLYEDQGFIWVMDKVRVTEHGVTEGSGPAAERVQKIYNQFIIETNA
ncbi:MAG: Lsm family RNA-binding protein [Candidatus Bathyarchaeota archaeon]|nr:Lsm family RNA-binding protein [Candidatus Termiticorpusculum sp.]